MCLLLPFNPIRQQIRKDVQSPPTCQPVLINKTAHGMLKCLLHRIEDSQSSISAIRSLYIVISVLIYRLVHITRKQLVILMFSRRG